MAAVRRVAGGADPVIARAHHGSVSKEQRALIEDDLKRGRLPCVVATISLELGIDMGAVDLVVQVESPPSVASGLQRVGRAGHQVGAVSARRAVPQAPRRPGASPRSSAERMRAGEIEALRVPAQPARRARPAGRRRWSRWTTGPSTSCSTLVRRAASVRRPAAQSAYDAVARPARRPLPQRRVRRAAAAARLGPRRRRADRPARARSGWPSPAAAPSPTAGCSASSWSAAKRVGTPGRRARRGDGLRVAGRRRVHASASTSWRIEDITHDRVLVSPAPGQPGRLPFWNGDALGPAGRAGSRRSARSSASCSAMAARAGAARGSPTPGSTSWAADNLSPTCDEQREATGVAARRPHDRGRALPRRARRLAAGRALAVRRPGPRAVGAGDRRAAARALRRRRPGDARRRRHRAAAPRHRRRTRPAPTELIAFEPDEIEADRHRREVGGSALFASRFRECAARALLLPRRDPGRRSPLWQQRQRAAQLLEVAVAATRRSRSCWRRCASACRTSSTCRRWSPCMRRRRRRARCGSSRSRPPQPSPFARSLLFGYVARFMYEGDSPLAERRAAALALDPALLAELLGQAELRELLDPEVARRGRGRAAAAAPSDRRARRRGRRRPAARCSAR